MVTIVNRSPGELHTHDAAAVTLGTQGHRGGVVPGWISVQG
ncbi:hypothetical protein ACFOLD_15460 [Kocuria carniphila]